jgi:hypothetical protein
MMQFLKPPDKLPDEALDKLRTSLDEYDRIKANTKLTNPGDVTEIANLRARLQDHAETLTWSDIAQADYCIIDLLDESQLRGCVSGWRRRLREVAGDTRYSQYLATATDITPGKSTAQDLRTDAAECVRAVYYFYAAYGIAAHSRSSVTQSLFRAASLLIVIELAAAVLLMVHRSPGVAVIPLDNGIRAVIEYFIATSICAVLGSVVSVQRRLQDPSVDVDPFYRYIQTTADKFSIAYVSPIFGAIFGVLALALLQSKLLSTDLISIDANGIPTRWGDVAGLLIFGFLAGFAEQLVPDALTRIAARALGGVAGAAGSATMPAAPSAATPLPGAKVSGAGGAQTPDAAAGAKEE